MRTVTSVRCLLFALVVLTLAVLGTSATSSAQVAFSVSFGPPPLPVYEQPFCPGEGFLWTPGYWAYDYGFGDYYWVPGTWVRAPRIGYFWTPGYWAYSGNRFVFYDGYWGPQVGFYGGINYGYGYFGNGYDGGRWERGRFFYNRSVNNVNVTNIHNVYNTTVINQTTNRVSFNGGNGGISARPTRQQETFAHQRHLAPVSAQTQHRQAARVDREQRASVNHGRPAIAASPRPGDFKNRVPAREAGGVYNPPANRAPGDQRGNRPGGQRQENNQQGNRPGQRPENQQRSQDGRRPNNDRPPKAVHPNDQPRGERPARVNTGDARRDQQNQRDQQRLSQRQDQERQRVQRNQEQQNQRMERQRADDSRRQQAEQQHQQQQQTQRVEQRHEQQQQRAEPQKREQQPQQRQQPAKGDESKPPKKDRPPNER
ncbi:MAG: hypothetical protein WAQ52_02115 [Terriglobales bacterium]